MGLGGLWLWCLNNVSDTSITVGKLIFVLYTLELILFDMPRVSSSSICLIRWNFGILFTLTVPLLRHSNFAYKDGWLLSNKFVGHVLKFLRYNFAEKFSKHTIMCTMFSRNAFDTTWVSCNDLMSIYQMRSIIVSHVVFLNLCYVVVHRLGKAVWYLVQYLWFTDYDILLDQRERTPVSKNYY